MWAMWRFSPYVANSLNTFNVDYADMLYCVEWMPAFELEAGEKWSFQHLQIFRPSKTGELFSDWAIITRVNCEW